MWAAEGSKLDIPLSCFEKKMRNVNLQARFCKKEAGIVFRGVSWRFWWCQAAAVGPGSLPLKSPSAISEKTILSLLHQSNNPLLDFHWVICMYHSVCFVQSKAKLYLDIIIIIVIIIHNLLLDLVIIINNLLLDLYGVICMYHSFDDWLKSAKAVTRKSRYYCHSRNNWRPWSAFNGF
jgi:hypothetical protein